MGASDDQSKHELNDHQPIISVAQQRDSYKAVYLWLMHFGVWLLFDAGAKLPATLIADHPGSRTYLVLSSLTVMLSFLGLGGSLTCPLCVLGIVLAIPYILLLATHLGFIVPTFFHTFSMLHKAAYDASHCFWVAHCHCARCRGDVVGMVGAERFDDHTLELVRMYVSPRMRRQGLGRQLSAKVTQFAKSNGYRHLRLTTLGMFSSAIHLYTQQGYREINKVPYPSSWMATITHITDFIREV